MASSTVCAIFGLGRAGQIHFGNLLAVPSARVKYIVDAFTEAAEATVSERFSDAKVVSPEQEDAVLADPEVTFCVISSPTPSHEAIIRKCIAAGKHMFCEKPVATSVSAMTECYALAQAKGLILHCSFNRRYDPSFNLMKQQIPEVVGNVHTVRTCSRDSPYPKFEFLRFSGGMYHDCGVHDINMVCWLMDDWPVSVFASGTAHDPTLKEFGDHDTAVIVMRFPRDRIAIIEISRFSAYGYDQRIEINGQNGMLASNNISDRAVTASNSSGTKNQNIQYSFPQRYAEAYKESMRLFLLAVRGDSDAASRLISAIDSINSGRIADAAEESISTGRPVPFTAVTSL